MRKPEPLSARLAPTPYRPNRAAPPEEVLIRIRRRPRLRVVAVGDLHFPFVDEWRLGRVLEFIRREKPDAVVQMGDLFDLFNYSRFPRDSSIMTPEEEVYQARAAAERFWEAVHAAAPRAKCHQLLGNHCMRIVRAVRTKAPEIEAVLKIATYHQLWEFPGVTTQETDRHELELDGVIYHHGHRAILGSHMAHNLQNTVVGHTHRGGVVYRRFRDSVTMWELNAGYLADDNAPAMAYTAQSRGQSVPGIGFIGPDGPHFLPL